MGPKLTGEERLPEEEHRLWPGTAPGSEGSAQLEGIVDLAGEGRLRNVVVPTLTVVTPAETGRTGAGAIIAPGGGFHMLSWSSEGLDLARWLAARGVTAFVLKYRLADTGATSHEFEQAFGAMWAAISSPPTPAGRQSLLPGIDGTVIDRAVADGRRAVSLVRQRAEEFGVDPALIAMVGFSAGAVVTVQAAVADRPDERPDLAVVVYGGALHRPVPEDAPPAFFVGAADDPLHRYLADTHAAWREAGRPAELHLFERGGHGFGVNRQGLPVDTWPEAMWAWFGSHGFVR